MKLRKIVKHIDFLADAILLDNNNNTLWEGKVLDLHAAADKNKDKKIFIKECKENKDFDTIRKVLSAEDFLDWKLDTDDNCEAIGISHRINNYKVDIPVVTICLKKG